MSASQLTVCTVYCFTHSQYNWFNPVYPMHSFIT